MSFKSVVLGVVMFCCVGLAACSASNDSTTAAGSEEKPAESLSAVQSDKVDEYSLPDDNDLLFGDDAADVIAFDAPLPTTLESSTTDSSAAQDEGLSSTTRKPFTIRVSKESQGTSSDQSPSSEKIVPVEYGQVNASLTLATPGSCSSVKLDKGALKEPLNTSENDAVLRQFVSDAYWFCLQRPKYAADTNTWYRRLKEVAVKDGATIDDLEARSKEVMRIFVGHNEPKCILYGTYDCIPSVELVASEGYSLDYKCAFTQAEVAHESGKVRLAHLCQGVDLDIKVVPLPQEIPEFAADPATPAPAPKPAPAPAAPKPAPVVTSKPVVSPPKTEKIACQVPPSLQGKPIVATSTAIIRLKKANCPNFKINHTGENCELGKLNAFHAIRVYRVKKTQGDLVEISTCKANV